MTGAASHLQHSAAEVKRDDLLGPAGEAEERLHRVELARDHGGVGPVRELTVTGHVIAMPVGVGDDQLVALARMLAEPVGDQPVDSLSQRELGSVGCRASVEQQGSVIAEEQVQERRLVVDRLALAQDDRVLVVVVHLDLGITGGALRRGAVDPPDVQ